MKSVPYILLIVALGLLVALRFITTEEDNLPKNQYIKFAASIRNEPRVSYDRQVIKFADISVYTNLYPRYRVGDRLQVSGIADEKGRMYGAKIDFLGRKRSFSTYFSGTKSKISANIKKVLPSREAALVEGTILGIDNIEPDFRDALIRTGTIHVVVVSGQNLMIVAGLFLSLVKYLGRRLSLILAIIVVFLYAALTGFEPPVVRASLVVLASSLAIFAGRESGALRNLLIAALIILIVWPRAIADISFQLTFAASLGIIVLGRNLIKVVGPVSSFLPVSARSSKSSMPSRPSEPEALRAAGSPSTTATRFIFDILIQNAAIATSAYIFTAPIILFYFGRISLVAPLVNLVVAELVAPVMIGGFLLVVSGFVWISFAKVLALFVYIPATFFVRAVVASAKLPFSQIDFGEGNIWLLFIFYIAILPATFFAVIKPFSKFAHSATKN